MPASPRKFANFNANLLQHWTVWDFARQTVYGWFGGYPRYAYRTLFPCGIRSRRPADSAVTNTELISASTDESSKVMVQRPCLASSLRSIPRLCVTSFAPARPPHTWNTTLAFACRLSCKSYA